MIKLVLVILTAFAVLQSYQTKAFKIVNINIQKGYIPSTVAAHSYIPSTHTSTVTTSNSVVAVTPIYAGLVAAKVNAISALVRSVIQAKAAFYTSLANGLNAAATSPRIYPVYNTPVYQKTVRIGISGGIVAPAAQTAAHTSSHKTTHTTTHTATTTNGGYP